jgi:hypothetical protein
MSMSLDATRGLGLGHSEWAASHRAVAALFYPFRLGQLFRLNIDLVLVPLRLDQYERLLKGEREDLLKCKV